MTPLVFFVRAEQPASAAVDLMLAEHVHRVLVLGRDGALDGIVSTTDVLRAVQRGEGDLTLVRPRAKAAREATSSR